MEREEVFIKRNKIKDKRMGVIRFIAELYRYQLLPYKIVVKVAASLVQGAQGDRPNEEDAESLVELLERVGPKLDIEAQQYMSLRPDLVCSRAWMHEMCRVSLHPCLPGR